MKLGSSGNLAGSYRAVAHSSAGFTFTNLLVSTAIFLLVMGGILSSHLFGLRLITLSRNKLGAFESSPKNFQLLLDDIRGAKKLRIGQGDNSGFTEAAANTLQTGIALQLWPTDDTNLVIRYYVNTNLNQLVRLDTNNAMTVLFTSVSNAPP